MFAFHQYSLDNRDFETLTFSKTTGSQAKSCGKYKRDQRLSINVLHTYKELTEFSGETKAVVALCEFSGGTHRGWARLSFDKTCTSFKGDFAQLGEMNGVQVSTYNSDRARRVYASMSKKRETTQSSLQRPYENATFKADHVWGTIQFDTTTGRSDHGHEFKVVHWDARRRILRVAVSNLYQPNFGAEVLQFEFINDVLCIAQYEGVRVMCHRISTGEQSRKRRARSSKKGKNNTQTKICVG